MSGHSNLIWVNKSRGSSSLSNCRNEKEAFRKIRSHAVTVGHKSSRLKRPIKRTPFNLSWVRSNSTNSPSDDIRLQPFCQKHRDNDPHSQVEVSHSESRTACISPRPRKRQNSPSRSDTHESNISRSRNPFAIHPLSSRHDPFSSYSISLNIKTTLEHLWYFEHIWTQCAFKLPGCIGYGQLPISQCEVTAVMQQCLIYPTRAYCLLAATSARMQYIHHPRDRVKGQGEAHGYAAKALQGLQGRMQKRKEWEEEEATDVLFLAAYEIFCEDEVAAGKHLAAVRKLYKGEIENTFVRRLQANLEILVEKSVAGNWFQDVNRSVHIL